MSVFTIAFLTIREAQRRRILWIALAMGLLFILVFGIGLHYIVREFETFDNQGEFIETAANGLTIAGLYIINFLIIIMSVLISVAAISSEIETRLIDIFVTKPIGRWQIVLGKWLGFGLMSVVYTILLAGGILLVTYFRTGYRMVNNVNGIALLSLNALVMMSISIAGGTRLSTLANGVLAFMMYGVAFVGGWVEIIGSQLRNETAVNIGIITSLLVPIEAMWKKALLAFQPRALTDVTVAGPFAVGNEPSDLMVWYALLYVVVLLTFAVASFGRRDL